MTFPLDGHAELGVAVWAVWRGKRAPRHLASVTSLRDTAVQSALSTSTRPGEFPLQYP
jgi:hypothetical protein